MDIAAPRGYYGCTCTATIGEHLRQICGLHQDHILGLRAIRRRLQDRLLRRRQRIRRRGRLLHRNRRHSASRMLHLHQAPHEPSTEQAVARPARRRKQHLPSLHGLHPLHARPPRRFAQGRGLLAHPRPTAHPGPPSAPDQEQTGPQVAHRQGRLSPVVGPAQLDVPRASVANCLRFPHGGTQEIVSIYISLYSKSYICPSGYNFLNSAGLSLRSWPAPARPLPRFRPKSTGWW